jgi:hypothetical protein
MKRYLIIRKVNTKTTMRFDALSMARIESNWRANILVVKI